VKCEMSAESLDSLDSAKLSGSCGGSNEVILTIHAFPSLFGGWKFRDG